MTPSKTQQSEPVIYPPKLDRSLLSNKYEEVYDFKWGTYEKQIKVSKELGSFNFNLVKALNEAFLEGSESKPYGF